MSNPLTVLLILDALSIVVFVVLSLALERRHAALSERVDSVEFGMDDIDEDLDQLFGRVEELENDVQHAVPSSTDPWVTYIDGVGAKRIVPFVSTGRKPSGLGWDVA